MEAGGLVLAAVAAAAEAEEDKGRRGRGRECCGGGGGGDDAVLMLRQPQDRAGVTARGVDEEEAAAPAPRWKSCLRSMARCCLYWGMDRVG